MRGINVTEYVVLRDLGRPTTHELFDAPRPEAGPSAVEVPSEPRIEAEALTKDEVRSLSRDPEVRAIARGMPTTLVYRSTLPTQRPRPPRGCHCGGGRRLGAHRSGYHRRGAGHRDRLDPPGVHRGDTRRGGLLRLRQRRRAGPRVALRRNDLRSGRRRHPDRGGLGVDRRSSARCSATTGPATPSGYSAASSCDQGAHVISMSLGFDSPAWSSA